MIDAIEPLGVPADLLDIQGDFRDVVVSAFALIPFTHLALVFWRSHRVADNQFRLDRTQVHGLGDELRIVRNAKRDRIERNEK